MHWILLIICCASVYGGMVAKSPVAMALFFLVAVVSCVAWLRVRYTLLFPGGTAATAGAGGLSDVDLDSLRAHVRAHAQSKAGTAPETLERPADPEAIRLAAQRVADRDAELARLREESERAALALRAAEERRVLEAAREKMASEDAQNRVAVAAPDLSEASPVSEPVADTSTQKEAPIATPTKPQGPEREVGEVWNPYAGAVQTPKKEAWIHPTLGDAHHDA